nr:helix-turn-helix domain-containing protein [Kibdelosporangium sp. MJ126-NF4]CEL16267.1 hypothetical protein [Kibdelosporangium sp. MJ126-NF4]CTQ94191.1 hypothetical protein [Kibdelosporangium sp. MJ126-NF4]
MTQQQPRSKNLETPTLWGPEEVGQFLKVPTQTVYQWRSRGYGPTGTKVGKHVRYVRTEVIEWFYAQLPKVS